MSDIEILLRELIEKVDKLENKVDNLTNKVKTMANLNYGKFVWGDDSTPPTVLTKIEIGDIVSNPYEITCETKGE